MRSLAILCVLAVVGAESEMRTWTDASGSFSVEATLVSVEEGIVHLERADGGAVQIRLEQLSQGATLWLEGLPTVDLADDDWFELDKPCYVVGAKEYKTALGSRTVRVLRIIQDVPAP